LPYHPIQVLTSYSILPKIIYGASDTSGRIPTEATGVFVKATCSKQDLKCIYLEYTSVDICGPAKGKPSASSENMFSIKGNYGDGSSF